MKNRTLQIALLGTLIVGFCWWNWTRWRHSSDIAAGFATRVVCSCRYVEGRGMDSCRTDLRGLPGLSLVYLSDEPDERRIIGRVPLLAERTARHLPGFGCVLAPS